MAAPSLLKGWEHGPGVGNCHSAPPHSGSGEGSSFLEGLLCTCPQRKPPLGLGGGGAARGRCFSWPAVSDCMHVGAGSVSSCQKCHSLTFALDLGLPIPRLTGREVGREQHQPHLCGDEKPLWALQGTPGWREGNRCANPGGHADPKLDGGLECGARGINSPTLCVGRATGGGVL